MTKFSRAVLASLALAVIPLASVGQPAYPTGSVRIISPYPAGGPASIVAQAIAEKLHEPLGKARDAE